MIEPFESKMIAPCGMNCRICLSFFGYAVNGRKRKNRCIGCRPRDKQCAFVKKRCDKLLNIIKLSIALNAIIFHAKT